MAALPFSPSHLDFNICTIFKSPSLQWQISGSPLASLLHTTFCSQSLQLVLLFWNTLTNAITENNFPLLTELRTIFMLMFCSISSDILSALFLHPPPTTACKLPVTYRSSDPFELAVRKMEFMLSSFLQVRARVVLGVEKFHPS